MNNNETNNEKSTSLVGLSWIAWAVFALGIAVLAGFYWNSVVKVQNVTFDGNHFVSVQELQQVSIPTGISPDSMNFIKIIEQIEDIPYVKRADVSIEPSGNLLVSVTERQPVALLADGSDKVYVDSEGLRLPILPGKAVDVPVLYGFSATPVNDTLKNDSFKTVADFLSELVKRPVSNATLSEIAWTRDEGIIALSNQNGVKLIFGNHDYQNRLRNWEAFYGEVVKVKGMERMRSVDLRFRGQIVTREERIQ